MPKQTLLDMTQEILSAMSSDEVNSIGDTTESLQVATCIKRKYFDIVSRSALPEHTQLIQLNPSNDNTMPTLMYVPNEVNSIEWIKYYNTNTIDPPAYSYVNIVPMEQFMEQINGLNTNEDNIGSYTFTDTSNNFPGTFTIKYQNNTQPKFCTIISNWYVLFDSYDSTQDDTLQSSKTMCKGQIAPAFSMNDNFIPDMDDKQFPLLLNEAKALAFYELKQQPHAKAEQEIKRQWSTIQKNKSVTDQPTYFDRLPDFGRRGSTVSSWYGNGWYRQRGW